MFRLVEIDIQTREVVVRGFIQYKFGYDWWPVAHIQDVG